MAALPHGLRLRNPFNLEKNAKIKWEGLTNLSSDPIFCEFISDLYGLRAGFINLKTQINEGYNSIQKLIYHYAPPSENDTKAYVKVICHELDKNPDDKLSLLDLKSLGKAIIKQEQGYLPYSDELIEQALKLAGVIIDDKTITNDKPSLFDRMCQYLLSRTA